MNALTTIVARLFFGIPVIIFGLLHFMMAGVLAGMVPFWIPGGVFWVYLTGLALILGGVAVIIKKWGKLASLLLALMLAIFILAVHMPGLFHAATRNAEMMNILKNLIMIGGALAFAGAFQSEESAG